MITDKNQLTGQDRTLFHVERPMELLGGPGNLLENMLPIITTA
jgi:hypothetical protein